MSNDSITYLESHNLLSYFEYFVKIDIQKKYDEFFINDSSTVEINKKEGWIEIAGTPVNSNDPDVRKISFDEFIINDLNHNVEVVISSYNRLVGYDREAKDKELLNKQVLYSLELLQAEWHSHELFNVVKSVSSTLSRIKSHIQSFPINLDITSQQNDQNSSVKYDRLTWHKTPDLFFVFFNLIYELGLIEKSKAELKSDHKKYKDWLRKSFMVLKTDGVNEYASGSFLRNLDNSSELLEKPANSELLINLEKLLKPHISTK